MLGKGINILFKKIKLVLTMLNLKNLKITGFFLSILTNWVLLFIIIIFFIFKFLNNEKKGSIVTNNFSLKQSIYLLHFYT
jgi:hypothetical protein